MVTALVVTHNHERFVAEAIASALAQTLPPEEVVVLDDGSTDGTLRVVRAIKDPRLRIVALPHRGIASLAETYSLGVSESRSGLIGILEGDDRWPPDKLERQIRAFDDPNVVLAHGMYRVIGARGGILHPGVAPYLPVPAGRYDARPFLLTGSYIMAVTTMFRREGVRSIGGFRQLPGTPHWDYPTFLELSRLGAFAYFPVVLGEWRRHERSAVYRLAGIDLQGVELSLALALDTRGRTPNEDLPSPRQIERAWADAHARMIWHAARILLLNRRFDEARVLLRSSRGRPASLPLRMRLLLAWVASLARFDLEALSRLRGARSVFEELD